MRNILLAGGLLWLSASCWAGISLDATRIIFSSTDDTSGQSVGIVSSSDSPTPYLIRTQILATPYGDQGETPFLVTPSLFRLEPGATNQVRIMKKNVPLPQDKESVFYLRAIAIPASNKAQAEGKNNIGGNVQISTGSVIKLFYRPANLAMSQQQAMSSLIFTRSENGVTVYNSSPYYITLNSLKIANTVIPISVKQGNTLIAPMSRQTYSRAPLQGTVEWIAINDYGGMGVFHGKVQ
ncbi:molecular chaperone [Klebsiella sp. BIGb0407]|uniref:fimbrial biogenesis chaperone n=1 Tax=Klebsiella sp. BIGb0407 TaxID=2940603 RepID=UPI002167977E|nr:molecular chaperone [Klebsiella sp. BIGb0407]MCS3433177.1 P pilus assembly chaperone PapD [Klebsiella sp. BIGb0407]